MAKDRACVFGDSFALGAAVDYAASKGPVDTMTLGRAREERKRGVRVNAVRPSLIESEIRAGRKIVLPCSAEGSYVTGALADVSGGR